MLPTTATYYASAIHYAFLKAHLMRLAKPFQLKEKKYRAFTVGEESTQTQSSRAQETENI